MLACRALERVNVSDGFALGSCGRCALAARPALRRSSRSAADFRGCPARRPPPSDGGASPVPGRIPASCSMPSRAKIGRARRSASAVSFARTYARLPVNRLDISGERTSRPCREGVRADPSDRRWQDSGKDCDGKKTRESHDRRPRGIRAKLEAIAIALTQSSPRHSARPLSQNRREDGAAAAVGSSVSLPQPVSRIDVSKTSSAMAGASADAARGPRRLGGAPRSRLVGATGDQPQH
jgi:hypothetical protein